MLFDGYFSIFHQRYTQCYKVKDMEQTAINQQKKPRFTLLSKDSSLVFYSFVLTITAVYQAITNNNFEKEANRVLFEVEQNERAVEKISDYLDTLATGQTTMAKSYCESYKKITQKIYKQPYECFYPTFSAAKNE